MDEHDPRIHTLEVPAAAGSVFPHATFGDDGRFAVCWTEPDGDGHRLRFCRSALTIDGTGGPAGFGEPRTIARGDNWFVNWADFPAISVHSDGGVAAHWLERCGENRYDYGVRFVVSVDDGESFTDPEWLHDDTSAAEHGFVSWMPFDQRSYRAVWLDFSAWPDDEGITSSDSASDGSPMMTLRTRLVSRTGEREPEQLIDARVCECCSTDVTALEHGFAVVYRDRSDDEVRDIGFAVGFEEPRILVDDGWERPG